MSSMLGRSGVCSDCDCFGYVWEPSGQCDPCHTRAVVREAFATDPALAERIYAAATADDALRLLGVEP